MKITKSRLKKIIAEEVQRVRENVGGDSRLSFSPEEISAMPASPARQSRSSRRSPQLNETVTPTAPQIGSVRQATRPTLQGRK